MPRTKKIRINDNEHNVPETKSKRLLTAIKFGGYRIPHKCGGHAQCTTCRVHFKKGEPEKMTVAEYLILKENNLFGTGVRLSCQIEVEKGMEIDVIYDTDNEGFEAGPLPQEEITPAPEWVD